MLSDAEEVKTRVEALNVDREREFVVGVSAHDPHRIRRAFLTVPTRLPCQGGLEPLALSVDDTRGLAVPSGEHRLRARFERDDFSSDLVLDLELDEGRCVRTAVYSTALPFEVASKTIVSVSLPLLANTALRGLHGVIAGQFGIGRWFGPMRVFGEVGLGGAYCDQGTCGKDSQNQAKAGLAVPVSLQATWRAVEWELPRATGFGLVGLRYSYVPVRLPTLGGDDSFAVHAVHAELGWGMAEVLKGNLLHMERAEDLEIMFPVGALVDPNGKTAFSAGLVMRFLIPI
jgi:hypothetical protein